MNAILILGNQLFSTKCFPKIDTNQTVIFMREDAELCTHFKYHKKKILFFLSAMRKYAQGLREEGFKVEYQKLGDDQRKYDEAFAGFLKTEKISTLYIFEIEDKFFEKRIHQIAKTIRHLRTMQAPSPMFLTSRAQFAEYLHSTKKPFMKTFYEGQRKRLKILVNDKDEPTGGRWSFDDQNRLKLPKDYHPPEIPNYEADRTDTEVAELVNEHFSDHPGDMDNLWLPTDRKSAEKWLDSFLNERLNLFGPYEDALSPDYPFINHSVLTPFLNVGLLTPADVIKKTLAVAREKKLTINSVEGFVRQIIGWREFIRGIYQNYSEQQDTTNFFNHTRKLNDCWYDGTTGVAPLDDVIRKTRRYGWAHHIERLMVVGSLMLLLEVHPREAHRWFMEMFIDSSDWVMGPNVYGMALFSDGGIFATKPYFCGSNYYKKMGPYSKGDWQEAVDGLYWGFIDRNRKFFAKNPRLSMSVKTFDKMDKAKKKKILTAAAKLKSDITSD